jgi:selenide, water dikinase
MARLPRVEGDRVLVGTGVPDDAGVFRLTDEIALVQTVDFFTPIVDDPVDFGRIAAANALSDVYAMGGVPLTALAVVCFPQDALPLSYLEAILRGGIEKAAEAGCAILGGHTIDDREPKYGLAVTGTVHPDRFWTAGGARPGDRLVLTKPLGTGIVATGIKKGIVETDLIALATRTMATLNRGAADAGRSLAEGAVHAVTDVTGFGLVGHLGEMARYSKVTARVHVRALPVLPGVMDLIGRDAVPGGTRRNLAHMEPRMRIDPDLTAAERLLAADAQTSGGLLFSVAPDQADALVRALTDRNTPAAAIVGEMLPPESGVEIVLVP